MSAAQTAGARRWAALGLLIVLPCVLAILSVANVVATADTQARSASLADQSARYRTRLAALQGDAAPSRPDAPLWLEAPSRSLAEAELQRRLVALGEAAAARIVESGSADLGSDDDARLIEASATLDLDNGGLLRLLHAVETGVPLMTVTRLAVRSLNEVEADPRTDPLLRVEIAVRAAWRAPIS